ncbi:MAG: hypothetical protein IJK67_01210 [Bacilli bacterium]|nr:hypothetical protein [Bacilli bacterium]
MKYNEELYSMSKTAQRAQLIQKKNKKEISTMQKRLLKYILKELRRKIYDPQSINNGYIEIIFFDRFFSKPDPGYEEIKELINSNNFYSFASEYCIYLSEVENRCDDFHSSYYKLVWDYQTYFNSIKKEAAQRKLKQKNNAYKGEN